jgi:hypothetical protein
MTHHSNLNPTPAPLPTSSWQDLHLAMAKNLRSDPFRPPPIPFAPSPHSSPWFQHPHHSYSLGWPKRELIFSGLRDTWALGCVGMGGGLQGGAAVPGGGHRSALHGTLSCQFPTSLDPAARLRLSDITGLSARHLGKLTPAWRGAMWLGTAECGGASEGVLLGGRPRE